MNLTKLVAVVLVTLVLGVARPSAAGVIFSDNFNGENGGVGVLNYNGFANWTVSGGTVDLIGNGYYDFLPGNGLYVDMDGSTGNAGLMLSKPFVFVAGVSYTLSFDLAGNHRNGATETVVAMVTLGNLVNQTYSLSQNAPFTRFSVSFTPLSNGTGNLSFEGLGGDNIGMLLDNVELVSVPDSGATLSLLGAALFGLGALRRKLS